MRFFKNYQVVILILVSIVLYFFFGYFLERSQFIFLFPSYFALFVCFYFLMKLGRNNILLLIALAILFRLIFLFTTPNLSQDFYRFIWDGRMIFEGFNPYLYLPETFIQQRDFPIAEAQTLYDGMGKLSGSNYTNYPPIKQFIFFIAALFAGKSIFGSLVIFRIILILADIGILYFGKKILEKLNISVYHIFWYLLNPFIIIELTGNLHFESLMLFFLLWSFYQLQQKRWIFAAILLGCSISVKLIPLLFLPLFYQWFVKRNVIANHENCQKNQSFISKEIKLSKTHQNNELMTLKAKSRFNNLNNYFFFLSNWKSIKRYFWIPNFLGMRKLITFYAIVLITTALLFLPFYSSTFIDNYLNSVGLWFRNFEFNASFYYIFREIGYWKTGYNEIATIGKITPILTILFLLYITFFRKNRNLNQLITACLFGLSFYFFTTTTMHPWYLSSLILLSVFTKYRFPIVWSLVIVLSYSAYKNEVFEENLWLISVEYLIVYGFLTWELISKRKQAISLN